MEAFAEPAGLKPYEVGLMLLVAKHNKKICEVDGEQYAKIWQRIYADCKICKGYENRREINAEGCKLLVWYCDNLLLKPNNIWQLGLSKKAVRTIRDFCIDIEGFVVI